jgi:hypothetical protein
MGKSTFRGKMNPEEREKHNQELEVKCWTQKKTNYSNELFKNHFYSAGYNEGFFSHLIT